MIKDLKQINKWKRQANRRLFLKEERAVMTRKDWLVMMAVTLVYACVAFINLGAHEIPETYYAMEEKGDEVIVEFADTESIEMIKYFTALGKGKVSFSYSIDGEGYTQVETENTEEDENGDVADTMVPLVIDHGTTDMYEWQFIPAAFEARYVSVHVDTPGIQMLEMAFCDSEGLPVDVVTAKNIDPEAERGNVPAYMFDEQHFVPQQTYYMTEMYFDEVYHARTAYEHIYHLKPYETTHPPLGKIIIGIGIRIFGMNPFGWRFMGTLFGVLMLPLMYVLAKRLFKKTLFAFIPTFLFAVDFMHYTQTRIATIDSYSIFFILLMYLFMYIYTEQNYNKEPFYKSLVPLALSGVAFGLAAATKWLCLYGGAGLAIIFFMQLWKRYREYIFVKEALADEERLALMGADKRAYFEEISQNYIRKTFVTLLWCILFFIIVPIIIYCLSYIPYMLDGVFDFKVILDNQESMFNYHSNLQTDKPHPFSSEWYKWPIIYRPVFFFQGHGYTDGMMSSMSTMGNPAIWWGAIVSVITMLVIRLRKGKFGKKTLFLSIAALSQYLPWVLISRETFIYHYFATITFLILLMGVLAKYLIERTRRGKTIVFIFLGVAGLLFVMFYPVTTGIVIPKAYSDIFLRWLPTWPFY